MKDTTTSTAHNQPHSPGLMPRERRILLALLNGSLTRENADRVGRVSNSPHYIGCLRNRGLTIHCVRHTFINEDGTHCRPGEYHLAAQSRALAERLLNLPSLGG